MMKLSEVLDLVEDLQRSGDGWLGRCPAHQDNTASLSINVGKENRLLLYCHATCTFAAIVEGLGVQMSDLAEIEVDADVVPITNAERLPPTAEMVLAVTAYCEEAASHYPGSPAATYAEARFGLTEAMAAELGLGYDDGTLAGPNLSQEKYHDGPRLVVPFRRIDGVTVGLQGRRLDND